MHELVSEREREQEVSIVEDGGRFGGGRGGTGKKSHIKTKEKRIVSIIISEESAISNP